MNTFRFQIKDTFSLITVSSETIKNLDSYCVYLGLQNLTSFAIKHIIDHLSLKQFQRIYLNIEQNPKLSAKDIDLLLKSIRNQRNLEELQLFISESPVSKNGAQILQDTLKKLNLKKIFLGLQGCQIQTQNIKKILSGLKNKKFTKIYLGINKVNIQEQDLEQYLIQILPHIQCQDIKIRYHELHAFDGPGQRKDKSNLEKLKRDLNMNKELAMLSLVN